MTQKINNPSDDLFIIAIGASAGGMEAIHLLFDNTPEDGAAYVIVQHLSPDHKSFMAELLAKHSKLKISVAEDAMPVIPNRVYLMPKGKNMTIKDRKLYLTDIKTTQRNTSIDIFFDSLAVSLGEKSIGVILSGTGTDGTKGIAAIKKNGGYVIVQDPESAMFDGMPNSAIDSGYADVILPPNLIPDEIIAHLSRDVLENNFSKEINEADETKLREILQLIQERTPLDFSDYKRPTIIRRIVLRMAKNKITSLRGYIDFLKANPSEVVTLANEFMISVTHFFRDREAFQIIREKAIREIIENKLQVDTLKVWVVGCATGEEAYSIAILILEQLTEMKKNLEVKIFASDIDKSALLHASKGIYPQSISKDVSKDRLERFFIKVDNKYKIRDNVRKMVIFADHDIVKQPPYGKIDLISCRNLLIYMNPILQKKILASLHFCLNMGGYLFLGPSESLGDLNKSFVEVDKKWKIYKSIEVVRYLRNTTYNTPGFERQMVDLNLASTPHKNKIKSDLSEEINQTLMELSGYEAGIWVDSNFEIIQTYGNYEKFLLPKIFNFNLREMLPEELSIATSTTLRKAVKSKKTAIIKEVKYKRDEEIHSVNVFVKPIISENPSTRDVILVLFSEEETEILTDEDVEFFGMDKHSTRYLDDLKAELSDTKQKLQEAYDALEVSNDNISSYNEELISSNEEMQSTNEELQSVNEELQTVNNEYQLKIKELAELNDDLNNYFKSTINAQLYVDANLILRKFTPTSIKQVNLKPSDIGRPISDISTNIKFSTMMDDIHEVMSSGNTIRKEVQTLDNRWYQMIAIPYIKEHENQNNGVIITFNDITELKLVQDKLSKINAEHKTFIYAVSHDLKGPLSNLTSLTSYLNDSVGMKSEDDRETLEVMEKSIQNLSEIVHELSDITKIEHEIHTRENINLEELVKEIKFGQKEKIDKSKATIKLDLGVEKIPFSKKNLRGILTNLMSNALKYHSPDRPLEVTIRTEQLDECILLSVEDNGLGIPEYKRNEIFDRFKRAHTHVEGSGIGLYLVKRIITNAGGKIEVESEVGTGSTFKVYFKNKPPVQNKVDLN